MAGMASRYEVLERMTSLLSYVMIPMSGAFTMASWLPDRFREGYLLIPMPHGVEIVRAGVFGEFVHTYYHPAYAFAFGALLVLAGLVAISGARDRVLMD